MSNNSGMPNLWSLLKGFALAIFPPLVTLLPGFQLLTHNRLLTLLFIALYEFVLFFIYILMKIWKQLEDDWIKQIASVIDLFVRNLFSHYYYYYRQYFLYEHRDLDMKGLSTQGVYTLDLEQVFVELRIDPKTPHDASANPLRLPKELSTDNHTIWEYLQEKQLRNQELVVLGAPGSGKTTLLKHMGLILLYPRKHRNLKNLPRLIPFLLFLRDHSVAISETPNYRLSDAIRAQMDKWNRRMPPRWIERLLSQGRCLILLDGLDEVADPMLRQTTAEWVEIETMTNGKNRFVLTSRPFGYRSNPLAGVATLEVQPFTFEQVKQFVSNWYLANEIKSTRRDDPGVRMKAEEGAKDLIRRLNGNSALFALAVNPLLLTMIATVHRFRGSLPGARVTLYKEICEVFLGKRQEARGVQQELRADQRQLILQPLAYHLMDQGKREISATSAEQVISTLLQRVSTEITPRMFFEGIENTSGLLLEREQGVYAFAHLTFQEYLAASHIREHHGLERALVKQVESSWWRETILLYCAQTDATPILEACLEKPSPSVTALALALECLQEARDIHKDVKLDLSRAIDQGIENPDPERRRIIAEVLLAHHLHQMHPLTENIFISISLVTNVEYQLFLDEQQMKGYYYQPDHWVGFSFPLGEGRQPVLGVRYSDALAFCEWLTHRDPGIWRYRLPVIDEYEKSNELWNHLNEEVGFWTDGEYPFLWSKGKPPQTLQKHLRQAVELALSGYFVLPRDRELDLTFALDRAINYALSEATPLTLDNDLDNYLDLDQDHSLKQVLDRALNRDQERSRTLARAHDHTLSLIFDDQNNRDRILDLYMRLFVIQKRFHKDFAAYEGILLVKERIDV